MSATDIMRITDIQTVPHDAPTFEIADPKPTCMDFMGVVKVFRDGRIEIADGKTPDDAARAFWQVVQNIGPEFLK